MPPRIAAARGPVPLQASADCHCRRCSDTQRQVWLCVSGVSRSWRTQVLFEPSEHLWQSWALNLNMISPFLPSYWDSPLPLDVGYLFLVGSNILLSMVVQQYYYYWHSTTHARPDIERVYLDRNKQEYIPGEKQCGHPPQ